MQLTRENPVTGRLIAAVLALAGLLAFTLLSPTGASARKAPNVILIQLDDMSRNLLQAKLKIRGKTMPAMPNLLNRIGGQGVEIDRYYSSHPLCGPSRASLLSGKTTRNHGMLINAGGFGYPSWRDGVHYRENLPVWLQRTGYRTTHIGKYMNGYGQDSATEVPPGWSRWVTPLIDAGAGYYGQTLNIDGRAVPVNSSWQRRDRANCKLVFFKRPGACRHATDMYTSLALQEIRRSRNTSKPFYLQLDYNAPHDDGRLDAGPTPPTRLRKLSGAVRPRLALKDREPNPNSPVFIREQQPLTAKMKQEIRQRWINEVLSVRGVDQGIGRMIRLLTKLGQMRNTYLIFTSDNGMFHGESRIAYGKYLPHEPSTRQPLLVRGPGLPAGKVSASSGSNLDLAPTVLRMAGAPGIPNLDGRSLLSELRSPRTNSKVPVLLEGFNGRDPSLPEEFLSGSGKKLPNQAVVLNYTGFVHGDWKYIRYSYGEHELYNLRSDPGERRNLWGASDMSQVMDWAEQLTDRLASCVGAECRQPDTGP